MHMKYTHTHTHTHTHTTHTVVPAPSARTSKLWGQVEGLEQSIKVARGAQIA